MKAFILIMVLMGKPSVFLGEYPSFDACQSGIRQIIAANIYKDAINNPEVQKAIDVSMKYQQEYQCVPKWRKLKWEIS